MEPLPESKHFLLEPLTEGVYAALARDGGLARSNAGVVDLGDRTLIFDAFMSPQAARDLARAAWQITGRAATLAVNSHHHMDHVLGNQGLPSEAILISTAATRAYLAEHGPAQVEGVRARVPQALNELEASLAAETNPEKREQIGQEIDYYRLALEDLPTLALRLPDFTFDRRLVFHGPARRVELITFGGGHTESDAFLYLPDDQIIFTADLVFNEGHPWLSDGNLDEWLRIYDQIEALDPPVELVVPGHGPVGTAAAFGPLRRYIPTLRKLVQQAIGNNDPLENLLKQPIPAAFSAWHGEFIYRGNLTYLYEKLSAASSEA